MQKKNNNKAIFIIILIILIPLVLFFISPVNFFKTALFITHPTDIRYSYIACKIKGGIWEKQGFNSRYCKISFDDAGKTCYSNSECESNKCIIGNLNNFDKIATSSGTLIGSCSKSNQDTCFTSEVTLNNDGKPVQPWAICD